jgi:N-hydroxyarylamine O-acetyltransferase
LAHLLAVPFENLSIHWGEVIVLKDKALFEKIVEHQRGGFCYELNGLFAWLLRSLGFEVSMLAAGVAGDNGEYSPFFDHMALMVSLDEPWLVDVGFGDAFRVPLRLDIRSNQEQKGGVYCIDKEDGVFTMMEQTPSGEWKAGYRFTIQGFDYEDFEERCIYHQSSPQSHFKQRRICTRATPDGRLTLSENRLISSTLTGRRHEQQVENEEVYQRLLFENFHIATPGQDTDLATIS